MAARKFLMSGEQEARLPLTNRKTQGSRGF